MQSQNPAHEVRLGSIRAAIWRNNTANGIRYNVTFSRLFKEAEEWKSSDSFGRDDLLTLAKVANTAHSWIFDNLQDKREERGPSVKG